MPWSLEFLNSVIFSLAVCLASFGSHIAVAQAPNFVESESLPQINDDTASGDIRIVDIIIEGRNSLQKIDLQNLLKIDLASISSRATLDVVISDAEQRLQALSRFSRVEIKLSKSTQPGFYNLTFDLDEFSDFYFGSGALLEYADHYEKSFTIQLYGGTKNLYNTDAMLDVDVQHRQTDFKNGSSSSKSNIDNLTVNLFKNNIFSTPFYLGLGYSLSHVDSNTYFDIETSSFDWVSHFGDIKLGIKRNKLDISALYSKSVSHQTPFIKTINQALWKKKAYYGVEGIYSNKSNLALIEDGYLLKALFWKDTVRPEYSYFKSRVEYSHLLSLHTAAQIGLNAGYSSQKICSQLDDCAPKYYSFGSFSLHLLHSYSDVTTFGLEASKNYTRTESDGVRSYDSFPNVGAFVQHVSPNLNLKVGFVLGQIQDANSQLTSAEDRGQR